MAEIANPRKRQKLLSDVSDSDLDEGESHDSRNSLSNDGGFKINEEYAKRFEHNHKREERQRLEEKFAASKSNQRKHHAEEDDEHDDSDEESTDESEDDDADLATLEVDDEILATLQAIKNKDPRVYDQSVKFYKEFDPDTATQDGATDDKPMYLQDYHRENLLAGYAGEDDEQSHAPETYQQEQDALKRDVTRAMHTAGEDKMDEDGDEDGDFMIAKSRTKYESLPARKVKQITKTDVDTANRDPETYLSNFMSSRAWLSTDNPRFQALESDDSEEEARADAVEAAYNLRFEDPKTANEALKTFSRDVGKHGVRRESKSGRKKVREREQEKKAAAKQELNEEKARLRKLKIEEAEDKVKRIRDAAGMRGQELDLDQWRDVIEGDFDDEKWEQEMQRRFGEKYYAEDDGELGSDDDVSTIKKRAPKKPKWDDDINIEDLVPEFDSAYKPTVTLSSDENDDDDDVPADGEGSAKKKQKTKKDRLRAKTDARRSARKERMKIEEMVDASLPLDLPTRGPAVGFRYRATSPTTFGMTARDILFADDSQLNEFAGLKKMAAFRDEKKKQRDRKKFSKKARLKQWRKETFGNAEEPKGGFERVVGAGVVAQDEDGGADVKDGERKKRRNKKKVV